MSGCSVRARAELLLLGGVDVAGVLGELLDEGLARLDVDALLDELVERDVGAVQVGHRLHEPVDVPVLGVLALGVLATTRSIDLVDPAAHVLGEVEPLEHGAPLLVDDLPLDVQNVVVLEDVLAHHEVLLLDALLGVLDLVREDLRLHRLVVRQLEAVHDVEDPVAGEQAHDLVLAREVEARLAGVALAARAAAQLVVDAPRLVALGAEHVEAAELEHPVVELDVDAAAGHVRRDRDGAGLARRP